jgi:hypothetical protein
VNGYAGLANMSSFPKPSSPRAPPRDATLRPGSLQMARPCPFPIGSLVNFVASGGISLTSRGVDSRETRIFHSRFGASSRIKKKEVTQPAVARAAKLRRLAKVMLHSVWVLALVHRPVSHARVTESMQTCFAGRLPATRRQRKVCVTAPVRRARYVSSRATQAMSWTKEIDLFRVARNAPGAFVLRRWCGRSSA